MYIAIVEDAIQDQKNIQDLLKLYQEKHSVVLHTDLYLSGEAFLEAAKYKQYHLLLIDIYMDALDGIETAARWQTMQPEPLIVFLTNSEEDIWRAVRMHSCFDYIRKAELDFHRLDKLLSDVFMKWKQNDISIIIQSGKKRISLKIKNIQYIVSHDKYTSVILKNNLEYSYRIPFSRLCSELEMQACFLLCNRGILLNMHYIVEQDHDTFTMQDGKRFPIRQKGRKQILDTYHDYQFDLLAEQEVME